MSRLSVVLLRMVFICAIDRQQIFDFSFISNTIPDVRLMTVSLLAAAILRFCLLVRINLRIPKGFQTQ